MRCAMIVVLCVVSVLFAIGPAGACTGFVVYGEEIFYGMNFDFDLEPEVRLSFRPIEDGFLFLGSFQWEWPEWADVVGYNSHGLFGTLQMVPPREQAEIPDPTIFLPELKIISLHTAEDVPGVLDILDESRLINVPGFFLHSLYGDLYGQAVILEAGLDQNHVFDIENDFMVMTNFYHHDLETRSLDEIGAEEEVGVDRFLRAQDMIARSMPDFTWRDGLEVLQAVEECVYTRFSLVIHPDSHTAYLVLSSEFSRIWKLDLEEQTIETLEGFEEERRQVIPQEGIFVSELSDWK